MEREWNKVGEREKWRRVGRQERGSRWRQWGRVEKGWREEKTKSGIMWEREEELERARMRGRI